MFSIDQLIAPPPLSVLISLFLIAGCDLIGILLLERLNLLSGKNKEWIRWQACICGAMTLAIILYPLALAHLTPQLLMKIIANFCMFLGIFHISMIVKSLYKSEANNYWTIIRKGSYAQKLLIFMLFGMALVSLAPSTNADALDYHLGFAIAILNDGGMPLIPEWFSGRLSGNGEVLNALGLSLGAEQFGSLLQYASLLSIFGIIFFGCRINDKFYNKKNSSILDLIALAAFSAPVILFLISAAKPQMWPIAMTTFAFALIIHPSRRDLTYANALIGYGLLCLLVMTASQAKFNYILEGSVLLIFSTLLMIKRGFFWKALSIASCAAFFIILPPIIWKASAFNTSCISALLQPIPGNLPGINIFINNLINLKLNLDSNNHFPFPVSILIPDSFGSFTATLGIGWLAFIAFKIERDLWLWSGILVVIICLSVILFFAPISARLYLAPYFWLLFILGIQPNENLFQYYKWLKWPIFGQAFITTLAVWYGALLLFPGALLPSWRTHVMEKFANGYEVMKWADVILPKNAIFLNGHRSMALAPREAISSDWLSFVNTKTHESKFYLDRLKTKKVSHILIIGPINYSSQLSNCYGKTIAGPGVGHLATRNPLNKGSEYEAWILEFNSERLPECAAKLNNR